VLRFRITPNAVAALDAVEEGLALTHAELGMEP